MVYTGWQKSLKVEKYIKCYSINHHIVQSYNESIGNLIRPNHKLAYQTDPNYCNNKKTSMPMSPP